MDTHQLNFALLLTEAISFGHPGSEEERGRLQRSTTGNIFWRQCIFEPRLASACRSEKPKSNLAFLHAALNRLRKPSTQACHRQNIFSYQKQELCLSNLKTFLLAHCTLTSFSEELILLMSAFLAKLWAKLKFV